jgi:DNA primase catalytic subunit
MMQLYLPINLDYQVLFKKKLGQLIPIHFKEQVKIDQAMRRMQAVAVEQAIDASYINRLIKAAKGFVNNFVIRFEKD